MSGKVVRMKIRYVLSFFFFFKQKTAYEIMPWLVGSGMGIRDRHSSVRLSYRISL